MKNLKGGLNVLTAVNLFILISCCCLVCKGEPCNLIQDPSFEDYALMGGPPPSSSVNHLYTYSTSIGDLGIWNISGGGVALVLNSGRAPDPLWPVYWPSTDTNCANCTNCTNGIWCFEVPNVPINCWNTPDGLQFIGLGAGPSVPQFNPTTVSQKISTPLEKGTYTLSFLQSALNSEAGQDIYEGKIQVQIVSANGTDVLLDPANNQPPIFTVPAKKTNWLTNSTTFHITAKGKYIIKFSNLPSPDVTGGYPAIIDGVSLVKK